MAVRTKVSNGGYRIFQRKQQQNVVIPPVMDEDDDWLLVTVMVSAKGCRENSDGDDWLAWRSG